MEEKLKIQKKKILIVEGNDEKIVFEKIFYLNNLSDIQIMPIGGKNNFPNNLRDTLIKDPKFHELLSIGIVRDADDSEHTAFQSVCTTLTNNGLKAPIKINEKTNGKPSIVVLILPGLGKEGSLENIFIESIKTSPIFSCIEDYFNCISKTQAIPTQIAKAKIHTYLSTNVNDPDKMLGQSVEANFWNLGDTAFKILVDFFHTI